MTEESEHGRGLRECVEPLATHCCEGMDGG